jgi:hypothetical protein
MLSYEEWNCALLNNCGNYYSKRGEVPPRRPQHFYYA